MIRMIANVIRNVVATLLVSLALTTCSYAQPQEQMQFTPEPPPLPFFSTMWTIYADGKIDYDAGQRLDKLISDNHIPDHSEVMLNSPGGSLLGGIRLGEVIRQHDLITYVEKGDKSPGICLSACSLAFLGGHFRYISKQSVYGVHRFYGQDLNSDEAQIISARVMQYIRDMGVDQALFTEMTKAGSNDVIRLSPEQLSALHVVNNGVEPTIWTIEAVPAGGGLYLKGQRDTVYGMNKFIIGCDPKHYLSFMAFFPTQGHDQELLTMAAQTLHVDNQSYHIRARSQISNGWLIAQFEPQNDRVIGDVLKAKSVGVMFQWTFESPIFLGFDHMEVSESGREKMQGLVKACQRH
jgi:hypothetical protein